MDGQVLEGLALSCKPLGEHDRLLTLLSESHGLLRLAVPGGRRPRSSLSCSPSGLQLRASPSSTWPSRSGPGCE
ncbi:MAG: recombination protein O N-terminal domain-containing protein, partial [Cyanobium sp.]